MTQGQKLYGIHRLQGGEIESILYTPWRPAAAPGFPFPTVPRSGGGGRARAVELELQAATLAGIGLDGAEAEAFNERKAKLAQLSTAFSNAVLDATAAFALDVHSADELAGVPSDVLARCVRTPSPQV